MNEFLSFFNEKVKQFPMHLDICYCKVCDWGIEVTKKGCVRDYPNAEHRGDDVLIVSVQDGDMELCFAKAHVALKEWLLEFDGGY